MIRNSSSMDRPVVATRNQKTVYLFGGIGLVVLALAVLLMPAVSRWVRADASVDASTMRFATVTRGDLLRDLTVQGRVVASLHPTLFSPGQGIVALRTRAGAQVREGDVLATIDAKELQSALEQSRAQLQGGRAELDRQRIVARQGQLRAQQQVELLTLRLEAAKRNLERQQRTFAEGLSNKADYETAQDNLRIAGMELEQARKELDLNRESASFEVQTREQTVRQQQAVADDLQKRVEGLTIRAPFDGMVASISVQDRDAVAANQAILMVVNLGKLELEIALPEEFGSETVIGTPATINYNNRDYSGRVTSISPEVVNSQVTAIVAFDPVQPEGLKQSQRLTTRLVFESKKNVLKVPRGAFLEAGGGRTAYVVDGKLATKRDISVGAMSASEVEVVDGLKENETIVLSDTTPLHGSGKVLLR